jgi:hypothetical protein
MLSQSRLQYAWFFLVRRLISSELNVPLSRKERFQLWHLFI